MSELIDKKKLLDSLYEMRVDIEAVPTSIRILDRIMEQPIIEQKKGEWVITTEYDEDAGQYFTYSKCSCCGIFEWERTNYCPNCGAKMKIKVHRKGE